MAPDGWGEEGSQGMVVVVLSGVTALLLVVLGWLVFRYVCLRRKLRELTRQQEQQPRAARRFSSLANLRWPRRQSDQRWSAALGTFRRRPEEESTRASFLADPEIDLEANVDLQSVLRGL